MPAAARRVWFIAIMALLLAGGTVAAAESWPQRPVRLITPLGAGSATDVAARLYAERLAERWGRPVVVENRPGADGIIGVTAFLAAHDPHVLLFSFTAPVSVNPLTHKTLPYDPQDLAPISVATDVFLVIAASATRDIHTLADLIDTARAHPGKLNWAASPGLPQFVFAAFQKRAGLDMAAISYRDVAAALQDLGEGRIDIMTTALATIQPQIDGGKARLIAVINDKRAPSAPDVPTAAEAGHPELFIEGLFGFFGTRAMPAELLERIAADVREAAQEPAIKARLAAVGQSARGSTPQEFAAAIERQRAKASEIAQMIGLQPQ